MRKQRELQGLRETGAALQTNARKLPPGPDRDKLLQDIARFRAQVATLQANGVEPLLFVVSTGQNERGQPIGQRSVGFGIRRPDVGCRAIVYPKSVGETCGHSRANDDCAMGSVQRALVKTRRPEFRQWARSGTIRFCPSR